MRNEPKRRRKRIGLQHGEYHHLGKRDDSSGGVRRRQYSRKQESTTGKALYNNSKLRIESWSHLEGWGRYKGEKKGEVKEKEYEKSSIERLILKRGNPYGKGNHRPCVPINTVEVDRIVRAANREAKRFERGEVRDRREDERGRKGTENSCVLGALIFAHL